MGDRFNTVAGWALFAGIIALGGAIVSSKYFEAERPEKMGYAIEGVEAEGEGGDSGPSLNTLLASADVAAGEKVFAKCAACHTVNQGGANGIGPNLWGTVGEAIAVGKAGFAFSDALKSKGGEWTFDNLDHWLKSPREFAPGTKMTFAGLGNPADRANLIAWLNTQGSNLPLPAPDAAPAEASASPAEAAGNATNAAESVEGAAPASAATAGGPATPTTGESE
ncbi:c-type cytochrome [Sphingobium naphthae]|jgi:cytochrome c|uniref:Cytochrome c family protein n=1 Tax=Sphingobium naphthae TaxID=1886786 RepID=A0ABU3ZWN0_9SPHN|nr:cytochrome c family protein [Sphingobium naphthae]MAN11302.1 cytochrome c family protein [Sphingobium sp.]MEC8034032.1 cytochrome c family protein [Pseudomonadota bacterium]PDH65970.1 MAG: cytochrome c family protein [Sphingomonadaceae bacterium MED-G03]MCC4252420.1 cytochrome c family protein [Sphingobium naphthae]MDV5823931.1 cytochrome c family protein [Sphingobium naphthae]